MPSHIARESEAAANQAPDSKTAKYGALSVSRIFFPVAIKMASTWSQSATELVQEIGRRITTVTEVTKRSHVLFQQLFTVLQSKDAVAFVSTFDIK